MIINLILSKEIEKIILKPLLFNRLVSKLIFDVKLVICLKVRLKVPLFSASNLSILKFALFNNSRINEFLKKLFVNQTKIS